MGFLDNNGLSHFWQKIKQWTIPTKSLTAAEYNALSEDQRSNGLYFVKSDPYAVGETVEWAGYEWIVVNDNGDGTALLSFPTIYELTSYGSGGINYNNTTLSIRAKAFEDSLPQESLEQAITKTFEGVTAKIFPPIFGQVKIGYLSSNQNRKRTFNGSHLPYFCCNSYTLSLAYGVSNTGDTTDSLNKNSSYGFVPFVTLRQPPSKITIYLNGEELPDHPTLDQVQELLFSKQDILTGTDGQVVGFDTEGKAVAMDVPYVTEERVQEIVQDELESVDVSGPPGATFTPSVSEDGVLSWTNNGDLENPASVDIKGPQGIQGEQGIPGEQGPKGDKGDSGENATINGENTLEIVEGQGVNIEQQGGTLTISATDGVTMEQVNNAINAAITGAIEGAY